MQLLDHHSGSFISAEAVGVRSRGWAPGFFLSQDILENKSQPSLPFMASLSLQFWVLPNGPKLTVQSHLLLLSAQGICYTTSWTCPVICIKKGFISTMARSGNVRWTEMEPWSARHCARSWGYTDNKDKELALTEFTVWMQDRYQRTLGTTKPNPVTLMR